MNQTMRKGSLIIPRHDYLFCFSPTSYRLLTGALLPVGLRRQTQAVLVEAELLLCPKTLDLVHYNTNNALLSAYRAKLSLCT